MSKTLEQQLIEQGWTPPKKKVEKVGRFVPKYQEGYYFIGPSSVMHKYNESRTVDDANIALGNCYRTREEATKSLEIQKARVRISDALIAHQGDWVADWGDESQEKYSICYNYDSNNFKAVPSFDKYDEQYSSEESCEWVIKNCIEDLNLIWGVK